MRYQVGRACAAAGYDILYFELDLLPDVSIAKEARDACDMKPPDTNVAGANAIFRSIITQPVRYAVMHDYLQTINLENPRSGAYFIVNTAVKSGLFKDLRILTPPNWTDGVGFNITGEDFCFNLDFARLPTEFASLIYETLPPDLPATRKNPLIIAAAWEGNFDRCEKLRRPTHVHMGECIAVVRGIHQRTTFAKWRSLHDDICESIEKTYSRKIDQAITARFIMDNDLSRIPPNREDQEDVPEVIWHPQVPQEKAIRELVLRRPDAKYQVVMAAITGQYQSTVPELMPHVSRDILAYRAFTHGFGLTLPDEGGARKGHIQLNWELEPSLAHIPEELDANFDIDYYSPQLGYKWVLSHAVGK
ncbi:uncharacterized protein CTRU02_204201 [Colletotrichum truncatum]|uniref:Uncharacterized protein n=1 Tax=Colletotrichum truncatum TaxID=5467 RepID=A0ACC3ZBD5_COLTU|nr:uncharacterized protein CTRU02_10054 [Colletotrichum truncatum]KAF6787759.1 hypothetical protein CTRU02_10054 [Colletotrichum truncatum]